jgi:membrane-bound lytic murein transglycosylase A
MILKIKKPLFSDSYYQFSYYQFVLLILLLGVMTSCEQSRHLEIRKEIEIVTPQASLPERETMTFEHVSIKGLPGWDKDQFKDVLPALCKSCSIFEKKKSGPLIKGMGTYEQWAPVCTKIKTLKHKPERDIRVFLESHFNAFLIHSDLKPCGLFTGYYESELKGSYKPSARYQYPIYKKPKDLIMIDDLGVFRENLKGIRLAGKIKGQKLVPYEVRADIRKGALKSRAEVLIWVDSLIDDFFLQIQGSGRVLLENGKVLRVGFDGVNGQTYFAIGKALIEQGVLTPDTVSMQSIRRWLEQNPHGAESLMNLNKSYVFFKEIQGEGPIGAQGIALTPTRSLAVDTSYIPLGVPLWLDAEYPSLPGERFQRLMVAQDTGGAIKGAVRGDVFWGYGDKAALLAGHMKSKGQYYILLPKCVVPLPIS